MSVKLDINDKGTEARISIAGRFDFDIHEAFGQTLEKIQNKRYSKYIIDLGAVEEIDSSALGMLLLLREIAGGDNAHIEIVRASSEIKDELLMANLATMFKIA